MSKESQKPIALKLAEEIQINGIPHYSLAKTARDHVDLLNRNGIAVEEKREESEIKTYSLWVKKSKRIKLGVDVVDIAGRKFFSQKMHDQLCQIVRIKEAVQFLGVSKRTVYNLILRGALKSYSMPGVGEDRETQYIKLEELLKFKEKYRPNKNKEIEQKNISEKREEKVEQSVLESKANEIILSEKEVFKEDKMSKNYQEKETKNEKFEMLLSIGNASIKLNVAAPAPQQNEEIKFAKESILNDKTEKEEEVEEYISPKERIRRMKYEDHLKCLNSASKNISHADIVYLDYVRNTIEEVLRHGFQKRPFDIENEYERIRRGYLSVLACFNKNKLAEISDALTCFIAKTKIDGSTKKKLESFFTNLHTNLNIRERF